MTTRKPRTMEENLAEAERRIAECRRTRRPERIHKSFEKLTVTELVPIPKHPEVVVPLRKKRLS